MIVLVITITVIAIVLLISFAAYVYTFRARKNRARNPFMLPEGEQYEKERRTMHALITEMNALAYESVSVKSFDNLTLKARYYHVKDGAPIQIQCHGYRGNPVRDFCGGGKLALEMEHNILQIEQRAHLDSEGNTITFGINERRDVLSWIGYLTDRFGDDVKIALSGVSMGAATVLMASEFNHKNVKCIVADCPYTTPHEIIRKTVSEMKLPAFAAMPLVYIGAFVFGRFRLCAASATEAVKKTHTPILLIHGESDTLVPIEMSREIAKAGASRVQFEAFPNAGHGLSFIEDFDRYRKITNEFFDKHLH